MDVQHHNWSTQQLAEFLAAVSGFQDEASALRGAVERAAEALEAEVAAVLRGEQVVASIGYPVGQAPAAALLAAALGSSDQVEVPGVGNCPAIAVPLEDGEDGHLILARAGNQGFSREEASLLRGMARVLTLTLDGLAMLEKERSARATSERQAQENARLLISLRRRQVLLERLAKIQRAIVRREPSQDVLDAVVRGSSELLGDDATTLHLIEESDTQRMVIVASCGVREQLVAATRRGDVGEGAGGLAIVKDDLVVMNDYRSEPASIQLYAESGVRAAMAAPVHEHGTVVGSLVVMTTNDGRAYQESEQEVLRAFAEHASLALTDARTVGDAIHQAFHDSLTELPNRALFLDRLRHSLAKAERTESPVSVLFLDLDGFKKVNDSLGHPAGDQLLEAVAERLIQSIRPADTAARFGGDEFAILLEDTPERGAATVSERVLASLQAPFRVEGQDVFTTASIGIAGGTAPADDLMRNADLAMYKAKGHGGGRYEVFEPELHEQVVERLELEVDLQRALERSELELRFQPIVTLESGRVSGVEALVRWRHPKRGLVPPGEFVPVAEETRLILPIGRWVLHEACRQASQWQRRHRSEPPLSISVNLSATQLQQPDLVGEVRETLETSRLAPGSLTLEITETVLMQDLKTTADRLSALKELGVCLAVDDFGTGYSSLQYLRGFPIDILKIAKSFVDGLGGASDESALAQAIIDLGEGFDLRVVAEGIEDQVQLNRLREMGCELGQGFLFARPCDSGAMGALLAAERLDLGPIDLEPHGAAPV